MLVCFALLANAEVWTCPACGGENEGSLCTDCHLQAPPEGMQYVPATEVEIEGMTVRVRPFFIDSLPVTYRDILPWMNEQVQSVQDISDIVTGQYDDQLQFLRYTPFTGNSEGTALTVPSNCFSLPVGSFTWEGAGRFLQSRGARLPTLPELKAAGNAGLLLPVDVEMVMSRYASMMRGSMGELLGAMANQAMFAGYSSQSERVMWEWTRTGWGQPLDSLSDLEAEYQTIARFYPEFETGSAGRTMGYFNVTFRGVVPAVAGTDI